MSTDPIKAQLMGAPLDPNMAAFIKEKVEEASARLLAAKNEIGKEIWGQDRVIDLTLACMVANGHLLSVGVPGLAKTLLVSRVATALGLDFSRIQFRPDLMPSDILGSEIMRQLPDGNKELQFQKGPIFTQFLMADEINRATPRAQAALLEAMQEKSVTVGQTTYQLQRPFIVMATQNPLEQEGTYPLPEAQLDRFLMRLNVEYPDAAAERRIMVETTATRTDLRDLYNRLAAGEDLTRAPNKDMISNVHPVMTANELIAIQTLARSLPLPEKVVDAAIKLVRRARKESDDTPASLKDFVKSTIEWGPGPRALQAFAQAVKAEAVMRGEIVPTVDDVLRIAQPILEHRMALSFEAKADNVPFSQIVKKLSFDI